MHVKIGIHNFGNIGVKGKILLSRELLLNNMVRVLGLDFISQPLRDLKLPMKTEKLI